MRRPLHRDPALGFVLLAVGLLTIGFVAFWEARDLAGQPWSNALFTPDGDPVWEGTIALRARNVPIDNFPRWKRQLDEFRATRNAADVERYGLEWTEWWLAADAPVETFLPLLISGRLPQPGAHEMLAGVYARLDEFKVNETTFVVVGRLKPSAAGLHFAYIMPWHESLEPWFGEGNATAGWLDPDPRESLLRLDDPAAALGAMDIQGGNTPTRKRYALGVILGLFVVALGGAIAHLTLFHELAGRNTGPFSPIFQAVRDRPLLVWTMHIILYLPFFILLSTALVAPVASMFVQHIFMRAFEQGNLAYVGEAYASKNIFVAALATFINNYALQTLVLTLLISLAVPMLGILKNLLSFAMAGFGMSPMWTGSATVMTFHSITMTLEFEAYILACFAVTLFWDRVLEGLRQKRFRPATRDAFKVLGSGALITAVMLAFAGLYEATTLILLR